MKSSRGAGQSCYRIFISRKIIRLIAAGNSREYEAELENAQKQAYF